MLSDTLFDAVQEIRWYQREYPQLYDHLRSDIERVVQAMDALRRLLDTPPAP